MLEEKRYIQRSLKTEDKNEAIRKGKELYMEILRSEDGRKERKLKKHRFNVIALQTIDYLYQQERQSVGTINNIKGCINNVLIPYFGSKDIRTFKYYEMTEFLDWLYRGAMDKKKLKYGVGIKDEESGKISVNTAKQYWISFKHIMDFARRSGIVDELPNIPQFRKREITSAKSTKKIEIVTVKKLKKNTFQKNIGIKLDEKLILSILLRHYENVVITQINSLDDLDKLAKRNPDLVFSGVKHFNFDDHELWLNDYLDKHNILYIASARKALDGEYNKSFAKKTIQKAGIATADFFTTDIGEHDLATSIPLLFPLFIKPLSGGDSRGIDSNSVVNDHSSFLVKVAEIHNKQKSRSLVETYLPGKEYSVGIFEDSLSGILTAMPVEIITKKNKNGHRILTFQIKSEDSENVVSVLDKKIHNDLSRLAKKAFKALGGKSFGRIDIKMSEKKVPYFIEANLMPGLQKGYFFRACLLNLEMTYKDMILRIVKNALAVL